MAYEEFGAVIGVILGAMAGLIAALKFVKQEEDNVQ